LISCFCISSLYSYAHHLDLHSFPTRRSSDLSAAYPINPVVETPLVGGVVGTSGVVGITGAGASGTVVLGFPPVVYVYFLPFFRRSEEHTSELQSRENLVCRLLLEKKK